MASVRTPVCIFSLILSTSMCQSLYARLPSTHELLDNYAAALDATESFIDFYEATTEYSYNLPGMSRPMLDAKAYKRGQHRADGRRVYHRSYHWGDFNSKLRNLPESAPRYHLRVVADGTRYVHASAVNTPGVKGRVYVQPAHPDWETISAQPYSGILGYVGTDERIDTVLRGAHRISVRPQTEKVGRSACYVIDADTAYGKYSVWLDPEHGYNVVKIMREVVGGQRDGSRTMPAGNSQTARVYHVRFKQFDGVWVPMEGEQAMTYNYADSRFFSKQRVHFKRTQITLDPDHDALGSFDIPLHNPKQDPELKNGKSVHIHTGHSNIKAVWQDGRVVDASGKLIDINQCKSAKETSLVNKPLPPLIDSGAALSGVRSGCKPILMCFVDIEQRPSRHCLANLARRAEGLAAKGVVAVAVQTSPVELGTYDGFFQANRIALPIHILDGDFKESKSAWGIKSLPWLILTDQRHVVRAEGFPLTQIESMLQTLSVAEEEDSAKR